MNWELFFDKLIENIFILITVLGIIFFIGILTVETYKMLGFIPAFLILVAGVGCVFFAYLEARED